MGSRDHSVTCATCGLQRGGLNDYKCRCDDPVITDSAPEVTLTFGIRGLNGTTRISWSEGSCMVVSTALVAGRWSPTKDPGETPSIEVVCRATALAVKMWIKQSVQIALEELP